MGRECNLAGAGRRALYVLAALLFLAPAANPAPNVWEPIGPPGATVFALADDPQVAGRVYAGTYFGGLYRSDDYGLNWAMVATPFGEGVVFALAADATRAGTLYAGTFESGLYKTTDGGASWVRLNGLPATTVNGVAVDSISGDVVLVAAEQGVYRSADGGQSWTLTTSGLGVGGVTLAYDCADPSTVYLGTSTKGVYRSHDRGQTWSAFSEGIGNVRVTSITCSGAAPASVFVAAGSNGFRLRAGNAQWERITGNLPDSQVRQIARDPVSGNLYAALDAGLFRAADGAPFAGWTSLAPIPSRLLHFAAGQPILHVASLSGSLLASVDGGQNWFPTHNGLQNLFVGAVATTQTQGQSVVYAATELGVFTTSPLYTEQGRLLWSRDRGLDQRVISAVVSPQAASTVFVGTENAGVWRSDDWAARWTQQSSGLVPRFVFSLQQAAVGSGTLYAGTSEGLFLSRDGGASWRKGTVAAEPKTVFSVATHPVFPGVAYFGAAGGAIFATVDDGNTVYRTGGGGLPAENISLLKIAPWNNFHAITSGGGYYTSADQGATWYRAMNGISDLALSLDFDAAKPWILFLGTSGGVYRSDSGGLIWTRKSDGLDIPYVFSLVLDPRNAATVYAGTVGRVYKSIDGAGTWTNPGTGLPDAPVLHLAIDPTDSQVLVAAVLGHGIYRSADGGVSWSALRTGAPFTGMVAIAGSPSGFATLYAGSSLEGVFRSTDAGRTWSPSSRGMSLFVGGLAIDASNPSRMYASTLSNGMFRSTDAGASWHNVGLHDQTLFDVAVDRTDGQVVFAGSSLGVARSMDAGETWALMGQRSSVVFSMAVHPNNRSTVHMGTFGGQVYASTDAGQTWVQRRTLPGGRNVMALAWNQDASILYAALDGGGVHRSADGGVTWTATDSSVIGNALLTTLAVAPSGLYAGSAGAGVFRSTDGGATWSRFGVGLRTDFITSIVPDPLEPDRLYASVLHGDAGAPGVYRLSVSGARWEPIANGIPTGFAHGLAVDAGQPGVLYAATETGVYKSQDGGSTWASAGLASLSGPIGAVLLDPAAPGRVLAGSRGRGVYTSVDGGATWTAPSSGGQDAQVAALAFGNDASLVYAATYNNGMLRSTSGGASWPGAFSPEFIANPAVLAIRVDPSNPSVIYAATAAGVMKSTDRGVSWGAVNAGLSESLVLELAIDPVASATVYAGTARGGVFVTDNGGATWSPLNVGLLNKTITSIAVDALDHRTIYVGAEGGGVLRIVRP